MTAEPTYEGSCHCGAIGFLYRTALPPAAWAIRACQCGFCRTHAGLSASDPAGSLEFVERAPPALHRYRFGRKTTDFLLCRNCGVYIGAMTQVGGRAFGIVNVRCVQSLVGRLPEATPMVYEDESVAERSARRESRWTPVANDDRASAPDRA